MRSRIFVLLLIAAVLSSCASNTYRKVVPGVHTMGQMRITVGEGWSQAPVSDTPHATNLTRTYTRNGLDEDRLVLVPGVSDGASIFVADGGGAAMPVFRSDMMEDELESLIETSVQNIYGTGAASVTASNKRPFGFAESAGVMFDMSARITQGSDYRGLVGAIVADDKLYVALFLAAEPEPYGEHRASAEEVIESMTIRVRTIKQGGFD